METCHCCGYKTIDESANYEICPICYWEDDHVQSADPWFRGGANKNSLFESQKNFKTYRAVEERFISHVRSFTSNDIKDPDWRELSEDDKEYSTTPVKIEEVWGTPNQISYNYWERNPKQAH